VLHIIPKLNPPVRSSGLSRFPFLFRHIPFTFSAFLVFLLGCSSLGSSGNGPNIDGLHLLGTPVAVDLDGKPGADGLGARVYASSGETPEAVRMTSGTLELLLFDGVLSREQILASKPLVAFTYSGAELRKHEHKTVVGMAYNFVPTWGTNAPTRKRVTVLATYRNKSGLFVRSAPITVPLPR
jgi:hypothetical protein